MQKYLAFCLLILALAIAESRVQQRRGLTENDFNAASKHPYLFLSVPRGRSGSAIQGFEVIEEDDDNDNVSSEVLHDDDDDDDNDDGNDEKVSFRAVLDDDELEENDDDDIEENKMKMQVMNEKKIVPISTNLEMVIQNAQPTNMMVSKDHAGAIMVPDGIIEIHGQSVIDEKTGKAALLVPRSALEAIPDGSIVALMERTTKGEIEREEERANRVIVRRRRVGSRRNVHNRLNSNTYNTGNINRNQRRPIKINGNRKVTVNGNRKVMVNGNRTRKGNNQRRRVTKRRNVQGMRRNPNYRRRVNNKRRVNRPVAYQI